MSAAAAEEMSLCSICLEVFSEPVSTPCGHNFCKRCICQTWDTDGPCTCPLCKRSYDTKPELSVNTLLLEMVSHFKLEAERSEIQLSKPGEVSCDFCSEPKLKALKSCLVCLSSFCETHLQLHLTVSGLKTHQLMEPVDNLEERMCPTHRRPLELFCRTDQCGVCTMCVLLEHKNHELVSLEEAREACVSSLLQIQTQNQHMVEQRRLKVQEIQRCVELSEREAHRETAEMFKAFTAIVESVQRCLDRCAAAVEQTQSKQKQLADVLIQQLEQEIFELEKSSTEAEQLSRSQNSLYVLRRCPALTPPAGLTEWSSVSFEPETCEGSAARALAELEKRLSDEFRQLSLESKKKFAVDVTLDPDTAHPCLVLSEDLRQVHHTNVKKQLPDSPLRFDRCPNVLGKQSFSSGRFYFEVQVKGQTKWHLGVAQESINRKAWNTASPKPGLWMISSRDKAVYVFTDTYIRLFPRHNPQTVGVFVDFDEGLVSFYDADSADLLYAFTDCCFREKLLPLLSPGPNDRGTNSAPLTISEVQPDSTNTEHFTFVHCRTQH